MVQEPLVPQDDAEDFPPGPPPPFRIAIDDIEYPCEKWETQSGARPLKRDWVRGWAGGMGTLTDVGDDSYYIANNMDLSTAPYARLRPRYEATIDLTSGGADPTYGFIATDGTWNFLYVLSGRYSQKIAMETNGATWTKWDVVETEDFGAGAVVGRPAFFESSWHVPLGANVDATRLDLGDIKTPPATDDWTTLTGNADNTALHFVVGMAEGVAQLKRAFDTNKVSATAAIGDAFAPTAGFEVGDSGEAIVDGITLAGNTIWSKPSSPYHFDDQGNNFAYQSFVGAGSTLTDTDGVLMASHGPYGYWPHSSGLWRLAGGDALPVGPMSDPLWAGFGLDGIIPTFYSEWNSAAAWERWIYATTQDKLFHGWIRGDGTIHWHGMLANTLGSTTRAFIVSNPVSGATGPLLCLLESGTNLNIMQLEPRGSTRRIVAASSGRRGAASEDGQFWLPFTTLNAPLEVQKRLRMIWVTLDNMPTGDTVTLTVRVDRDRQGATVQVGGTVTAIGTNTYEFVPASSSVNITSSSTANPTVITAAAAHGLFSGDIVTIAGHSSTPNINGEHVITWLSTTTFSIPVNVSSGGGEAGTITGTPDTFREIMLSPKLACAAGYDPSAANSDPRIRAAGIRAVTPHTYKAIIPVSPEGMRGSSVGVKDALLKLRALKSGTGVAVREPTSNTTFTGYVTDVREVVISAEHGEIKYAVEVLIQRWVL
jgi:hypothetical protein